MRVALRYDLLRFSLCSWICAISMFYTLVFRLQCEHRCCQSSPPLHYTHQVKSSALQAQTPRALLLLVFLDDHCDLLETTPQQPILWIGFCLLPGLKIQVPKHTQQSTIHIPLSHITRKNRALPVLSSLTIITRALSLESKTMICPITSTKSHQKDREKGHPGPHLGIQDDECVWILEKVHTGSPW